MPVEKKRRSRWVLRFLVALIVLSSLTAWMTMLQFDRNFKSITETTNRYLLNTRVTLSATNTWWTSTQSALYDIHVFNPKGFRIPEALTIDELIFQGTFDQKNPQNPMSIYRTEIKTLTLNYEISDAGEVNLNVLKNNLVNRLAPEPEFNPAWVLQSATAPVAPLKYTGFEFYMGTLFIRDITLNVYHQGTLKATRTLENVSVDYDTVEQPIHYGTALLVAALKLLTVVEQTRIQ